MSEFYASIQGNRGEATRLGTKTSGIIGHIRGWNLGVEVIGYVDKDGKNCFKICKTAGSSNRSSNVSNVLIAELKEDQPISKEVTQCTN